ncbi:MAG: SCP2 sterol-binding domain-containing protein [Deltaproteobacteria bacterium]|jgi:putative sterol carrier protein|nr:SCP2 sterol-binding domain-containing protein [Deltaproteobacteria bacterium]
MNLDELYAKVLAKSETLRLPHDTAATTILLDVLGEDPRRWLVSFSGEKARISEYAGEAPSVTVSASDKTVLAIADRSLNPTKAFLTGRLKIKGDRSLLKNLSKIWPD